MDKKLNQIMNMKISSNTDNNDRFYYFENSYNYTMYLQGYCLGQSMPKAGGKKPDTQKAAFM